MRKLIFKNFMKNSNFILTILAKNFNLNVTTNFVKKSLPKIITPSYNCNFFINTKSSSNSLRKVLTPIDLLRSPTN
jgi:hypothetical protein